MGNIVSSAVDKQQEKMVQSQKDMLNRQIEMQQIMRERMMAVQIAGARDLLLFYGTAMAIVFPLLIVGSIKRKNPALLGPLIPLSFIGTYQYDWAYHTKAERIMKEAEHILHYERRFLHFPDGDISADIIDENFQRKHGSNKGIISSSTSTEQNRTSPLK
jgi:hypothetical protein